MINIDCCFLKLDIILFLFQFMIDASLMITTIDKILRFSVLQICVPQHLFKQWT